MKFFKNVQGSQKVVEPIEINVDTVYIRENITKITNSDEKEIWQYDEKQLSLAEYLKELVPSNQEISDNAIAELLVLFSQYQQQTDNAIAELSIALGGIENV